MGFYIQSIANGVFRVKRTRRDLNEREIIDTLVALGYDVDQHDTYDLVVSGLKEVHTNGVISFRFPASVRVEVKQEGKELRKSQKEFYLGLKHPETYIKATNARQVLDWFGDNRLAKREER